MSEIKPEFIWRQERMRALAKAIYEYGREGSYEPIPGWVEELLRHMEFTHGANDEVIEK
jgi:hypothetical protein